MIFNNTYSFNITYTFFVFNRVFIFNNSINVFLISFTHCSIYNLFFSIFFFESPLERFRDYQHFIFLKIIFFIYKVVLYFRTTTNCIKNYYNEENFNWELPLCVSSIKTNKKKNEQTTNNTEIKKTNINKIIENKKISILEEESNQKTSRIKKKINRKLKPKLQTTMSNNNNGGDFGPFFEWLDYSIGELLDYMSIVLKKRKEYEKLYSKTTLSVEEFSYEERNPSLKEPYQDLRFKTSDLRGSRIAIEVDWSYGFTGEKPDILPETLSLKDLSIENNPHVVNAVKNIQAAKKRIALRRAYDLFWRNWLTDDLGVEVKNSSEGGDLAEVELLKAKIVLAKLIRVSEICLSYRQEDNISTKQDTKEVIRFLKWTESNNYFKH